MATTIAAAPPTSTARESRSVAESRATRAATSRPIWAAIQSFSRRDGGHVELHELLAGDVHGHVDDAGDRVQPGRAKTRFTLRHQRRARDERPISTQYAKFAHSGLKLASGLVMP